MFGFLIAIAAGFITPMIETPIAKPIVKLMKRYITLEALELRLIAFMAALLGAAIVSALLDSGSTFAIVVGAIIGYFLTRLIAAGRETYEDRNS